MIILGIDPGFAITGFGLVQYARNSFSVIKYGVVSTPSTMAFENRLLAIHRDITAMIEEYHPDALAVEELFFSKNITTGIGVAHARGVVLLAAAHAGIPVYEYTPMQVKLAVTGYGKADKPQIQQMIKVLLNLREIPKPDDAADALAVAICHAHTGPREANRDMWHGKKKSGGIGS